MRSTSAPAPSAPVDGGDPRRAGRRQRGGFRSQIHAALVVFREGGGRETYGPAPTQYVGDQRQGGGPLDHHRGRQMGRDRRYGRFALPAPASDRREKVLALRRARRSSSAVPRRAPAAPGRRRSHTCNELVQSVGPGARGGLPG